MFNPGMSVNCGLKLVLLVIKQIIKLIFRSGPRSTIHLVHIAKVVRALQFFGIGIAAIVDTIMCVIAIYKLELCRAHPPRALQYSAILQLGQS